MSLKLNSSGGGSVTLQEPSTATNGTLTLPAGTGTVAVNGLSSNIVSGTTVASTSGTSIDFTSIPSWVKRITVMFNQISTSGSSNVIVQVGAGSVATSGYLGATSVMTNVVVTANYTNGLAIATLNAASSVIGGVCTICNVSGNIWAMGVTTSYSNGAGTMVGSTNITLGGTLDRVRITTVNGTDTFDAGSINILYE
jgi:hypothetical protein